MYNVFFNKHNIGIISNFDYDTMKELNPQLKKGINIYSKSKVSFGRIRKYLEIDNYLQV